MTEGRVWGLTDADRRSALSLVTTGTVYDLGTPLSSQIPLGPTDTFGGFRLTPYRTPRTLVEPVAPAFDFSMELVVGSVHQGSHVDAPAHIHSRGRMYGGGNTIDAYHDFGWQSGGAETIPPIIARGVLLDVAGHLGLPQLPDGYEITAEDLRGCAEQQGVAVTPGDVVLVRTGKMRDFTSTPERYVSPAPGVGKAGGLWLYGQGMACLGTDTSGTEPQPMVDPNNSTHVSLLVERGVLLFEILDLEALASSRAYTFCFIALSLKIVGGTGSWVRPVAVV